MSGLPKFVDYVKIFVKAGDGGRGCVSFRREANVPRGGPNGGNGGRGGDIILEGDRGLLTLLDFKYRPHLKAGRGGHGRGKDCNGKDASDVIIRVPLGTVITDLGDGSQTSEILKHGQQIIIAYGGKGGRGNKNFATSVNRAPRKAESGRKGEEKRLQLELKFIADIGLIGAPNAGKSTLLNYISRASSKVASYSFTTLTPVLGVVSLENGRRIVTADIPGLIKGAYQGKGLGHRFLRHIERTRALVFVLDMSDKPLADYSMLKEELERYKQSLSKKSSIIAANKMDLKGSALGLSKFLKASGVEKSSVFPISALEGIGIGNLLDRLKITVPK